MFWSKAFISTRKSDIEKTEAVSHQLMVKAGLIKMLAAGIYSYLPLGMKVLSKIEQIIRQEMNNAGAQEVLLPALQPVELWKKTGRDEVLGQVMIRFTDRRGRDLCLGPTHEEVITDLVKSVVSSYKQLPVTLYQIQTKYRDEIRPRFGLIRSCEFIMKDAYSFGRDDIELARDYDAMFNAYKIIFKKCGLDFVSVEADSGVMGGDISHEFMIPAENGEDTVLMCEKCNYGRPDPASRAEEQYSCPHCSSKLVKKNTIEVGHIFKLGTKYTKALECEFVDENGMKKPIIMGCYGIGVSRLLPAIIEQNNDKDGIIWPKEIAPYDIVISVVNIDNEDCFKMAREINSTLEKEGFSVLLDDRDERAGVKFKDADLIGIPIRLVIGEGYLKDRKIEMVNRKTKNKDFYEAKELTKALARWKNNA